MMRTMGFLGRPVSRLGTLLLLSVCSYMLHFLFQFHLSDRPHPQSRHQNLIILLWHWPFGVPYRLAWNVCADQYDIPHCYLTDNRSDFARADAVVFHHHELWTGRSTLPLHLTRPPTQRWVWLSLEPPKHNHKLSSFNGIFNWTMSYRNDSDIPVPYGKLAPLMGNTRFVLPKKESCLASWVVSNYNPHQKRAQIYQQLKKFVQIAVYGKWVNRTLPKDKLLSTISKCYFYLAFENSVSRDYISEKLWRNAFQAGAVPVVFGLSRKNYELYIPLDSFIHVNDFESIEKLAYHLREVASDERQYQSYFKWRRKFDIKTYTDWRERLCRICKHFHQLPRNKVYQNLLSWVSQ